MTQTEQPSKEQLRELLRLPSTANAQQILEALKDRQAKGESVATGKYGVGYYVNLIPRCLERDRIQATRPEGCTCLGMGSKDSDPKYYTVQFEDEEPQVWSSHFCSCSEGIAAKKQARRIFNQEENARRWRVSGIPGRFLGFRLSTSPCLQANSELELPEPGESCFFWGEWGTGKTGLAVGLAWQAVDIGYDILFRSVPDLLSDLRSTYGRTEGPTESEVIKRYAGIDLLILDDMGAEQVKNSGWVEDRLYQIIGRRHGEELPTLFTSNLSPQELGNKIGERIVWRIVEMCGENNIIEVKGPNLRDLKHG